MHKDRENTNRFSKNLYNDNINLYNGKSNFGNSLI